MNIQTIVNEKKRGCGFRKQGGLYMMAGETLAPCGKLPMPLVTCPCCHAGIKPARGWTWIDPRPLFADAICTMAGREDRCTCILDKSQLPERMGLLWIGEKYYPTPEDFMNEARAQGVSRRITAVPKDFVVGQTFVAFAHRKGFDEMAECPECDQAGVIIDENGQHTCPTCEGRTMIHKYTQAIVGVFRPTRIEYVVKDDDSDEKLESLEKRGITLVRLTWDEGEGPEAQEDDSQLDFSDQILEDQERADFARDRDEDNISAADIL